MTVGRVMTVRFGTASSFHVVFFMLYLIFIYTIHTLGYIGFKVYSLKGLDP